MSSSASHDQDGRWQPYPSANMTYDKLAASVLAEKYYPEMGCVIINVISARLS